MSEASGQSDALSDRAAGGDPDAWGELLSSHGERLRRMVEFRLDPRLRGRVDPADVVQEGHAAAIEHWEDYLRLGGRVSLYVWLRGIVANKLLEVHRFHLDARRRDAGREVAGAGHWRSDPGATSLALFDALTGGEVGPGTCLVKAEAAGRVRAALASMSESDAEILALRHYEQLSNAEASQVLGIQERAAGKRYLRALGRLKEALAEMPGGLTGVRP